MSPTSKSRLIEWAGKIIPPVITGLIAVGGMLIAYGGNQATLNDVKESVDRHHNIDTPKQLEAIDALKLQAVANKTNIENIQHSLDDIKRQNERILMRLSNKNTQ